MLNFKTIETLKPNSAIIDIIKCYDYKTKNGKVKILENTNLKFIEPTEYLILSPIKITIYEYKINEISNKEFKRRYNNKAFSWRGRKLIKRNLDIIYEENKINF